VMAASAMVASARRTFALELERPNPLGEVEEEGFYLDGAWIWCPCHQEGHIWSLTRAFGIRRSKWEMGSFLSSVQIWQRASGINCLASFCLYMYFEMRIPEIWAWSPYEIAGEWHCVN
jgi:hypothetical protein